MEDPRRAGQATQGWGRAIVIAAVVLVLSYAGLMVVPDRLTVFLATRVTPRARDALVTLWTSVFFVFLCWFFVRVQRVRRG
jgi:hypothetical protein